MPYLPVLSFPGWVSGAKRPDYRQWDGGQHSEWSPLPHSAPTPHRTHVCWEFIRGSHLPSPCPWGGACPRFLGPPFPFFLNNLHFQCSFSLCSGLPLGRFAGQDGGEMQLSFSPSEPPDVEMCPCHCHCLVAQSCPPLCEPLDRSPPGSSVHGILQARTLQWVAISLPRVL